MKLPKAWQTQFANIAVNFIDTYEKLIKKNKKNQQFGIVNIIAVKPLSHEQGVIGVPVCGNCAKSKHEIGDCKMMKCGKCKLLQYCSVECQKADWAVHKLTCCKSI